jgi:hypothetical protein
MQYLLVEDGLRQVFRVHFLLDLEVSQWDGDKEHDKPVFLWLC